MTVAIANLAQLRKELGVEGQALLDYAPYSKIGYAPQTYDECAVPFKLLFGQITDYYTKKLLVVWILLYPPNKEGDHAEVQFHSLDPETKRLTRHDDSNISATITTVADAFRTPKKGSKSKHVQLRVKSFATLAPNLSPTITTTTTTTHYNYVNTAYFWT
jgi:hypothetical protein